MENKNWPVTEIPASGERGMIGGAYCHAFVYSNKGNFLLKGYHRECEDHLEKLKNTGLKFMVNYTLFDSYHPSRSIWKHSDDRIHIWKPRPDHVGYRKVKWRKERRKWRIRFNESKSWGSETLKEIYLKRLPNKWISELLDYNKVTKNING